MRLQVDQEFAKRRNMIKRIKFMGSMIKRNKEIEEGNSAAAYFHGELYGRVLGIDMSQELVEMSNRSRPQIKYIIGISMPIYFGTGVRENEKISSSNCA